MKSKVSTLMFIATLLLVAVTASADEFDDTISIFKNAGESGTYFAEELRLRGVPDRRQGRSWRRRQRTAQGAPTRKANTSAM